MGEVLYAFYENHKDYIISNKDSFASIVEKACDILRRPEDYTSEGFEGMSEEEFADMKVLMSNIVFLLDSAVDC